MISFFQASSFAVHGRFFVGLAIYGVFLYSSYSGYVWAVVEAKDSWFNLQGLFNMEGLSCHYCFATPLSNERKEDGSM